LFNSHISHQANQTEKRGNCGQDIVRAGIYRGDKREKLCLDTIGRRACCRDERTITFCDPDPAL